MIKKIFIIFFIILLGGIGFLYWKYSSKRTLITPYPYNFNQNAAALLKDEIKDAEKAKILIVGDQMGETLSRYTPELIEELAKNFKSPPAIYNWSKIHEGLHRTLYKLKSMSKLPSIIIYHGGSSELFEKTFSVQDRDAIFKNFSLFDDEQIISLIITFPWLSKVIYQNINYVELGTITEYQNRNSGMMKLLEKEVAFKLFDYELRELIDYVKDKKSHLILITTPLNLEIPPHEVCSHATTDGVIQMQQEIEELIKEGNFKKVYPEALALSNETFSNARSFYLLGKATMGIGELAKAREAFQKATVFDCANWRGNAVYNSIMKSLAKKRQIHLIDFDQYLSSALSEEGLFIDDIFPQNIFYQKMILDLKDNLKNILSID